MKSLSITRDQLTALKPCDLNARLKLFGRRKVFTVELALKSGVSVSDILWVAGRLGRKDICVAFALECAQRAVKFDKSGTAQPCIDAVREYEANPSDSTLSVLRNKRRDAYAADAYADAYAYADAAYAADAYAAAAAYAADAYADAAYADAYAAYADAADAAYADAYAADAYAAAAAAYADAAREKEIAAQRKIMLRLFVAP